MSVVFYFVFCGINFASKSEEEKLKLILHGPANNVEGMQAMAQKVQNYILSTKRFQ